MRKISFLLAWLFQWFRTPAKRIAATPILLATLELPAVIDTSEANAIRDSLMDFRKRGLQSA